MSPRRIFWISGWSIPAAWLATAAREALPDVEHSAIDAGEEALEAALLSNADVLGGFSLGAHLLLGVNDARPRVLLAPFADLKRETGLGGAVASTQIRQLQRMLRRDAAGAVADFHRRIGLAPGAVPGICDLAWGLKRMLQTGEKPAPLATCDLAVAGDSDPLLDSDMLLAAIPSLRVVGGASHDPRPLLRAVAGLLQSHA